MLTWTKRTNVFQIPKDGRTYLTDILDRCTELINYGIWGDLHPSRLRSWMANFTTDQERYFGACVLDNLIYRSKAQTISLMEHLFERVLADLSRIQITPVGSLADCLSSLRNENFDPGLRLVAAVRTADPITKSTSEVLRYMKRHLAIQERWIIKPWEIRDNISRGVKVYIFIDDFLGKGDQFVRLLQDSRIGNDLLRSIYAVYGPLVAHETGIKMLGRKYPKLRVAPVEILDDTYGLFHAKSRCFDDEVNSPSTARQFYVSLLKRKQIYAGRQARFGHGQLQLVYAFEHATPDNSLPILWWRGSPVWTPLFDR